MNSDRTIRRALISVYDKNLILDIANELVSLGVEILSTGGTQHYLTDHNIPVTAVEDVTGYPSIFGGRVKTLHPKVMGGILYRREEAGDLEEREKYEIPGIDLVIVDLYPFEEYVAKGATEEEIIEKIDIGGITLIRAAAKNFRDVIIVPGKDSYADLLELLRTKKGVSSIEDRRRVGTSSRHSGGYRDMLGKRHLHTSRKMKLIHQKAGCPVREIIFIYRQIKQVGFKFNPRLRLLFYRDLIIQINGLHDHAHVMIAVRSLPKYIQAEIDFPQCF